MTKMKILKSLKVKSVIQVNTLKILENLFPSLKYSLLFLFPRQNWTTSSPTITVGYFLVPYYC